MEWSSWIEVPLTKEQLNAYLNGEEVEVVESSDMYKRYITSIPLTHVTFKEDNGNIVIQNDNHKQKALLENEKFVRRMAGEFKERMKNVESRLNGGRWSDTDIVFVTSDHSELGDFKYGRSRKIMGRDLTEVLMMSDFVPYHLKEDQYIRAYERNLQKVGDIVYTEDEYGYIIFNDASSEKYYIYLPQSDKTITKYKIEVTILK